MVSTWKKNKRKTSKFINVVINDWNEIEQKKHRMGRSGKMEKENKVLGSERLKILILFAQNYYYYYYYCYYYYCERSLEINY